MNLVFESGGVTLSSWQRDWPQGQQVKRILSNLGSLQYMPQRTRQRRMMLALWKS